MIDCLWNPDGPPWKCQQCGYVYPRDSTRPPRRNCPNAPSRGLGDTVAKVIEGTAALVGLGGVVRWAKGCGGCRKRREALNRLVPYREKG